MSVLVNERILGGWAAGLGLVQRSAVVEFIVGHWVPSRNTICPFMSLSCRVPLTHTGCERARNKSRETADCLYCPNKKAIRWRRWRLRRCCAAVLRFKVHRQPWTHSEFLLLFKVWVRTAEWRERRQNTRPRNYSVIL